jgi:ATP-dependent RNA helicase DeaD
MSESEASAAVDDVPVTMPAPAQFVGTFDDLDIPDGIRKGLAELGYTGPTPVQRAVFAPLRALKDVLVQSRTGSGKTTAFALPTLCAIDPARRHPQALMLCPTRELALQVTAEVARLGHPAGLRVATIYGGASMRAQIDALDAGVHVVVGTPGRVKDLHRQGVLRFAGIRFVVLDEADEMLSRGFWDEVTSILDQLPDAVDGVARVTALFSATLPDQIERAARKYLRDPVRCNLSQDTLNVATIRHVLHLENEKWPKPRNFLYMLEFHKPSSGIVFCNRKDETEMICNYLRRFGYRAEALNGDMPQSRRERTLAKVKAGELDLMVATDVAARGIDISDLGHVFNYDLPEHDEVYVHRVGRTGRIGKRGTAASLVRGKYLSHLTTLKKQFKVPFEEVPLPDEKEILWMQAERLAVQILEDASGVEMEQYRPVAEALLSRGDVKEIVAFLLRTHYSQGALQRARDEGEGERPERADRFERGPRRDRDDRRERGPRPDRPERAPRADRPERGDAPPAAEAGAPVEGRDERDDRADRGVDHDDGDGAAAAATNLYVTLGRADGVADLGALTKLLADWSGVDSAHFTGAGDVRDHSAHLEVDTEVADKIIAAVHGRARAPRAGDAAAPSAEARAAARDPLAPVVDGEAPAAAAAPEPRPIVCERAKSQPGDRRRSRGSDRRRGRGGPPRGRR